MRDTAGKKIKVFLNCDCNSSGGCKKCKPKIKYYPSTIILQPDNTVKQIIQDNHLEVIKNIETNY